MDGPAARRAPLVAREAEIALVEEFLATGGEGFATLILEGEAGIGKTAAWYEGVATARDQGYRVLTTRPAPSEATFSFASVGDLADEVLEEARPEIPQPQLKALDVALLRAPTGRRGPHGRTVALGFLNMLRALSRRRRLLLAIDDLQWVDRASAAVLRFALRRLQAEPVRVLATRRSTETGSDLPDALEPGRVQRLTLGPLSAGALQHVVSAHLGVSMPRPVLLRIHETSGGNPFFALEMARALPVQRPGPHADAFQPVPESLGALVRDRLASLPPLDREVLLHVATMARPTREGVEGGLPLRMKAATVLGRAAESGMIVFEGDRIRFSHPLLGSVLYADSSPSERRHVHRRLAAVVTDPEERAWHLALAATSPDASVASTLERAAEQARSRGATDAAASLSGLALRLTPSARTEDRWRRTIATAEYLFLAGEGNEARRMLEDLAASVPSGPTRGEVLWRLGRMGHEGYDFSQEYVELFRLALQQVPKGHRLRAVILNALAWAEVRDDHDAASAHAAQSVQAAEETGDLGMLADALASVAFFACLRGAPEEEEAFDRAIALEPHVEGLYVDERPSWVRAVTLIHHDRFDEARAQIRPLIEEAMELGEENSLPTLRYHMSMLEAWAGDWKAAEDQADRGYEDAVETDQPVAAARLLHAKAFVHTLQGLLEQARGEAADSLHRLQSGNQPASVHAAARFVLGFIALSEGEPALAVVELGSASEGVRGAGIREPGVYRVDADLAEALVLCGDLERAESVIVELEARGRRLDRAFALATGARCRALLLAAQGDLDGALGSLETALVEHRRLPQPFELGRTVFALGQMQRRKKLKREARGSLGRALDIFEGLGAAVWAERARAELGRIGGRAPAMAGLSPTEELVAGLAAQGLTNREIADRLFMTVRTVEWNLSKVYRKLQVRSRTDLARAVGRD